MRKLHNKKLNPLNAELNPICHLLALLGGATIVVVSRLRVNDLYFSPSIVLVIKSKMRWAGVCSAYGGEERRIQGFGGET